MKKYLKQHLLYIIGLVLILVIGTIFSIWVQFLKGDILNLALEGNFKKSVIVAGTLLMAILLEILFMYLEYLMENKISYLCVKTLKADLFEATVRKDYFSFNNKSIGEYVSKFTTEVDTLKNAYLNSIFMIIMFALKIVFVTGSLVWLNWKLAIITLVLLTMPLYVPKLAEKKLLANQNEYLKTMEIFLGKLNNFLEGFELIKNYKVEKSIIQQFKLYNNRSMNAALKNNNASALVRILSTFMSYFSYFVIVAFSAYLVIEKDFNAGEFFIAINMIDQLSYPLIALSGCIQNIISVKDLNKSVTGYYGDTLEVRGIKPKVINQFKSKIEFKNVKFSYDENKAILQDISLSFEKGKKYLIKGPSGTGKTTLINLLLKYYKPTDGIISIDDMDIQEITTMYDIATVVRQDNFLFNDTLRNNLTLYQDISDEKLLEALEKVQLGKFANTEGLNMVVGNGGNLFSGGERKRICIARALLTNKEVLILDEPLANLDKENIEILEERILDLKNYTIIMITHIISEEAEMKFDKVINLEIL